MREHKIIRTIVCVIAAIFVVHQVYSSAYKPITTISAEHTTVTHGIPITATIIRDEYVIESDTEGVLHFVLRNGERVAKNGVIANVYSDAETSVMVNRIEQLKSRISDIKEIQSYNDVEAADISLAKSKVTDSLNHLIRNSATGAFSDTEAELLKLLTSISRKQMITGEQTDFSARLSELNNELDDLNKALPDAKGSIKAKTSGYFVSGIDGYENVLECDDLEKINTEFLDSLSAEAPSKTAIGKIVTGYKWYIAAAVSIEDSMQYKTGDKLSIKTSIKTAPLLDVTVEKINTSSKGEDAVLIFSCQQMNSELALMRKGNMTIIKSDYSGLRLPKKALRVQNGKTGVFVRSGITLKFVEVNVIYSTDDYIICEQQTSNEDVLRLYDDVVIKGKRLYDGKIVD